MLERRIISREEVKKYFSEKQIKGINKAKIDIPEIVELENENYLVKYFKTLDWGGHNNPSLGDRLIELKDKKTGFKIRMFASEFIKTYPLCNEWSKYNHMKCTAYEYGLNLIKTVNTEILEKSIDNIFNDLKGTGLKIKEYNGIIVDVKA